MRAESMPACTRRALLQAMPASLCVTSLFGCAAAPNKQDVAEYIRNGDFDAARTAAESLIGSGTADAQVQLMAGVLAFQAEDFNRAQELFASADGAPTDATRPMLSTGIGQMHWLRLAALRLGNAVTPQLDDIVALDPLGAVIAGGISADEFVQAKIAEARRVADVAILSIQQSPGRDAMLDQFAREHEKEYRCTGNFAAAQRSMAVNDIGAARSLLDAALRAEALELLEYHIAKAELTRLA